MAKDRNTADDVLKSLREKKFAPTTVICSDSYASVACVVEFVTMAHPRVVFVHKNKKTGEETVCPSLAEALSLL